MGFEEFMRETHPEWYCDLCGAALKVGEWPFCNGDPAAHVFASNFGEQPLEPYMDENIAANPIEITTRGQRRAIMRASGLEYKDVSRKKRGRIYVDMHR